MSAKSAVTGRSSSPSGFTSKASHKLGRKNNASRGRFAARLSSVVLGGLGDTS
jgi:hypothetical protein